MTTRNDIAKWLKEAPRDATHMLVACDMFDWSDYPVYTHNVHQAISEYSNPSKMSKVIEVYKLSLDLEKQLNKRRNWEI